VERDERYLDFAPGLDGKAPLRVAVDTDPGVKAREQAMLNGFNTWWAEQVPRLASLPETSDSMILRGEYLESFQAGLLPVGMLDRFKLTGLLASWYDEARDEIQTISVRGFGELVDGWIDLIEDVLEDTETKKSELFDPFEHKLVKKLLPYYLQEIEDCRTEIARLEGEKEAFEQQSDEENGEPEGQEENGEQKPNYAKTLQDRLKELKRLLKEDKGNGDLTAEIKAIEEKLAPFKEIMESLKTEKKRLKALSKALLKVLKKRRQGLSGEDCRSLVLDLTRADLETVLRRYVEEHLREVRAAVENLWDKYGVSLEKIQRERDNAAIRLDMFLKGLGYVN